MSKIDPNIQPWEVLIRCLLHPIWAKKGKMYYNALLPPGGRNDVSLLRLQYTNLHFCKQHAKKIKIENTKYWGLGAFQAKQTSILNKRKKEIGISANLVATPLDENSNHLSNQEVHVDTPGLPMHADLLYEYPVIKGEPSNPHRQYARELLKTALFKEDKSPENDNWTDGDFVFHK